jgi:hypothetical protein
MFMQLFFWGSADVPALLAEVTQAYEAAAAAESACVMTMLAAETSAREAAAAWESATLLC